MKKFVSGFIIGAMLFGALGAFAVSYVAEPATFKVLVNGKEFTSDPPALVVDGRTYLPLRAIGDALGVPVEWNSELGQAEVGTAEEADASGQYSRTNPAPLNTAQTYTYSTSNYIWTIYSDYSVSVKVLETIRGNENVAKIKNSYFSTPEDGYELMMVKVAITVLSTENDYAVSASSYSFDCFTSNNEETPSATMSLPSNSGYTELSGARLYEGGSTEGWIVVQVKKDDPAPKLAYGLDTFTGNGGIWFALSE